MHSFSATQSFLPGANVPKTCYKSFPLWQHMFSERVANQNSLKQSCSLHGTCFPTSCRLSSIATNTVKHVVNLICGKGNWNFAFIHSNTLETCCVCADCTVFQYKTKCIMFLINIFITEYCVYKSRGWYNFCKKNI